MKPYFPSVFETQLQQKHLSARIEQLKQKSQSVISLHSHRKSHSSKLMGYQAQTAEERQIARQNIELVKRLAEVKYGQAEIRKLWGSGEKVGKNHGKKLQKDKRDWYRQAENERLGKAIEQIGKRKKNMVLPEQ